MAAGDQDIHSLDNSGADEECSDLEEDEAQYLRHGWVSVHQMAERLGLASQAFHLSSYARINIDDLRWCLKLSRLLIRERDARLVNDQLAVLEFSSILTSSIQLTLSSTERILKLDRNPAVCVAKVFRVAIEYTIFITSLMDHLSEADLNSTNLESQALVQCASTMQTLLWRGSPLYTDLIMEPRQVGLQLTAVYRDKIKVMCKGCQQPSGVEPHLDNLAHGTFKMLLTDLFCRLGGLDWLAIIIEKLAPTNLGMVLHLLSMLAEMDGQVIQELPNLSPTLGAIADGSNLNTALIALSDKMLDQIVRDPEKLAERERAFVLLSRVFDTVYTVRCMLLGDTPHVRIEVDRDITLMQQKFVLAMLRSTNFNNLLSAARECHRLLQRAEDLVAADGGKALKDADAWLREHNVIQTLLKANLHQRQYADLVLSILQVLTKWGYMRTEHLDMLWSVTEAEGTFDVVKANVYCMIQDLAGNLDPVLLEQLFKKFEVLAQGCSVADSMRLLDLLKKLATSNTAKPQSPDSTNVTAERLLALIWKLTMPADATTELLACDAMADVLGQYGGSGHRLYCKQYLGRCCQELMCHQNVYTALRVMRRLLALYELFDQQQQQALEAGTDRESLLHMVLWELDTEFTLQKLLVDNLLHLMEQARAWVQAHGMPSPTRLSQSGPDAVHALRLPGHGLHSYSVVLGEYLQTISYVASKQKSYYDQGWVEQLWDALVVHPVLPTDVELGLAFIQDGASPQYAEFFSHATKAALLNTRITQLAPGPVSPAAWQVFQHYFYKVNHEEKLLAVVANHDNNSVGDAAGMASPGAKSLAEVEVVSFEKLHGCDFIWKAALEADHPDVAQQAAELLIQVYIRGGRGAEQSSMATATFIKLCTAACMPSALALAGLDTPEQWGSLNDVPSSTSSLTRATATPAASDVRTVQRCLFLLCHGAAAGQLPTMPLIPSHQSCYQGIMWEFDIHVQGANPQARRIRSVAAPQDYVGTVRRTLGAELGCAPQLLRLLHAGVEWKNDAQILSKVMQRPDQPRQLVQAAVSPVSNSYTQPGPDYAARWQSTALALLANEPHLYHMLLYMSDQAQWPELCKHAMRLLQLLPTCTAVPAALVTALQQPAQQAATALQQLLLGPCTAPAAGVVGDSCAVAGAQPARPLALARLLYWLQSLHGLLFPAKRLQDWDTQDASKQGDAIADTLSSALPDLPSPSSFLPNMAHCLIVLQQVLQCAGSAVHCGAGGMQRLFQVLDVQGQLVQLLANLSRKDVIQLMQKVCKGCNPVRPLPLEVLLCSPTNSPSVGCASAHNLATTPTGALQALTMATGDPDTDSSMTGGDAVAVAQVAGSRGVHPRPGEGGATGLDTSPGWSEMDASGTGRADRAWTPSPSEPPAVLLVGLLVHSSWQAAHLATATVMSEPFRGTATALAAQEGDGQLSAAHAALSEAAQVVRDGLSTLCKLLHGSPELYSAFLTNSTSGLLISDLLLNTHSSQLRVVGAKALRDICLSHQGPALTATYVWLLKQLVASRSSALQCTAANKEYFALLLEVVNMLPQVQEAHNHPVPCELASQLLREELVMLHACMAPPTASPSYPDTPMHESEGGTLAPGVAEDVPPGSITLGTAAGQQELQGRLSLVTGLIKALGRGAEGDAEQKALVQLLLTRYLFPEAVLHKLQQVDNVHVPPSQMQSVMAFCATEPTTRQAAFDLLLELMSACSNNMVTGTEHLLALHYSKCGSPLQKLAERKGEGIEPLRAPDGYCGLRNGGATCYMNSVVQQLYMQPRVRALLLGSQPVPAVDVTDSLYAQLQLLMSQLALSCAGSVRPEGFWGAMRDYDDQPVNLREHQDAHEFFTRLLDTVDSHLKSTGQAAALTAVFGGKFVHQIISREGPHRSEREEDFYQISVDVKGKGTLQSSLASYVQGELMEGENSWLVEDLGRKVQATRRTCFKQLPQSLIIHLKRFEYDHIQNHRVKVKERFEFPQTMDMYPYTAEGLAAAESTAAAAAAGAAAGALDDDATMTGGEAEQPPATPPQYLYELRGIVVHSGSAFAGHYYSFIKERPHVRGQPDGSVVQLDPNKWFSFDDRCVRPWDVSQLEEQCYGGPQTSMSGTTSSSTDSTQTGSDDRAFSAFLLFYDRIDGSCVEYDPVPSYMPAAVSQLSQPAPGQGLDQRLAASSGGVGGEQLSESTALSGCGEQQQQHAGAAGGPAAVHEGLRSTGATTAAPAIQATPYGMPQEMHESVLSCNMQLVRRMRAFEKDYLMFVRKACELRLERVASSRKARRTRLLDSGDEAPQSSGEASHALATGTPGGADPGGLSGAAQDAATQRDVDRVRACEEVMTLGLEVVLHVVLQAPSAIQASELELWQNLLQKLLGQGVSVAVRAVDTLLRHPDQIKVVQHVLLNSVRGMWLIRFLDVLQQYLVMYSNQACAKVLQENAAQMSNMGQEAMEAVLSGLEPVAAHTKLLVQLGLNPLMTHYQLLVSHHTLRHKRQQPTRAMQAAMEQPFHQHQYCLRLLGSALFLQAPGVNLLEPTWGNVVAKVLREIAAVWSDNRSEFMSSDYAMDLIAAAGCMAQVMLHVDDVDTVYRTDAQRLEPNDTRASPMHDASLPATCARLMHYPEHLAAPQDPGPLAQFAPLVSLDMQMLVGARPNQADADLLLQALFHPSNLYMGANAHLLQLVSWNDSHLSWEVIVHFLKHLQGPELDTIESDPSFVTGACQVAPVLLQFGDTFHEQRLNAALCLPSGNGQTNMAHPGIVTMLDAEDEYVQYAGWFVLASLISPRRLEQMFEPVLRQLMSPGRSRGQYEPLMRVLFIQPGVSNTIGEVHTTIHKWKDGGDLVLRQHKNRTLALLQTVWKLWQTLQQQLLLIQQAAQQHEQRLREQAAQQQQQQVVPMDAQGAGPSRQQSGSQTEQQDMERDREGAAGQSDTCSEGGQEQGEARQTGSPDPRPAPA